MQNLLLFLSLENWFSLTLENHLYFPGNTLEFHVSFPTIFHLSRHHLKRIVVWLKFHVEECSVCSSQDEVEKGIEGCKSRLLGSFSLI